MATGEVTPSFGLASLSITHGLGKNLKYFIMWEKSSYYLDCLNVFCWGQGSPYLNPLAIYRLNNYSNRVWEVNEDCSLVNGANSVKVTARFDSDTYAWVAIA